MMEPMIVWFPVSPTPKQLQENWVGHLFIFPDVKILPMYFQKAKMDSGLIMWFKYHPPNPLRYPVPRLSIQVSLPNVTYGNNFRMITGKSEIEEAIQLIFSLEGEKINMRVFPC